MWTYLGAFVLAMLVAAALTPLVAKLALGEAVTQLLLVGALVLMIWRPGA